MSFSRSVRTCSLLIFAFSAAFAADSPPAAKPSPLLPEEFAGWQMEGTPQTSSNPNVADSTNAPVLKEYRFTDFASATYKRDDGRTLKIRAARFADASGGFGAYTFYLNPDMWRETIGDQGASQGQRVLFYRGYVVVDALFSKPSAMSPSELRELAGLLPQPAGNAASLPPLLGYMPQRGYVTNTEKYAMGATALTALAPPIPASLVDFNAGSEVTLGRYNTSSGDSTLMLIYYPTPQIAAEHLRRIEAARTAKPGESSLQNAGAFFTRRSGLIVAIATGPASESDAKTLLSRVNWEANVTWNENTSFDQNKDLGGLLVNIIILCFILGAMAIVAGVAFGGIRILMKKIYPDKVFDRPEQMEFISLRLAETSPAGSPGDSPSGAVPAPKTPPAAQ